MLFRLDQSRWHKTYVIRGLAFPIWGGLSCPEKNRCRAVDVEETTMIPVLSPPKTTSGSSSTRTVIIDESFCRAYLVNPWFRWHYDEVLTSHAHIFSNRPRSKTRRLDCFASSWVDTPLAIAFCNSPHEAYAMCLAPRLGSLSN